MMTFAQLLDQYPEKASPPLLCNPLHHKAGLERGASPEEIEELLVNYSKATRLGYIFARLHEGANGTIYDLVKSMVDSSLNDSSNVTILRNFKIQIAEGFKKGLDGYEKTGWTGLIISVLANQSKVLNQVAYGNCACDLSQPDAMREVWDLVLILNKSKMISMSLREHDNFTVELSRIFDSRGWSAAAKEKLLLDIAEMIAPILERVLNDHELSRIFTFMDRTMGATYQHLLGTSFNDYLVATLPVRKAGGIIESPFTFAGFKGYIDSNLRLDYCPRIQVLIESIKKSADNSARLGQYRDAIGFYIIINLVRLVTTPSLKQITIDSLANTAALRLRLSTTDKNHLPFAILECTLALDIDPNHGKALFRRGLALALMKKWNEAIVDFQRAVELDPRSPAAKELAVALRQVTRRLGA